MSIFLKPSFSLLTNEYVQNAIEQSGFNPELEDLHSAIIKNAGLIFDDSPSLIHYHDNKRDIPVTHKYSNIRFSQVFSENVFGKGAPKIMAQVISTLVESTKLSKNPKLLTHIDQVFEQINASKPDLSQVDGIPELIKELSRTFKPIFPDFDMHTLKIPSQYSLEIDEGSGQLIARSSIIDRLIQSNPVYQFMKTGLKEHGVFDLTLQPERSSYLVIASKDELINLKIAQSLVKNIQTVEAVCTNIFKFPVRGHHRYEQMMAASVSPEEINTIRDKLGLEPFSSPISIPFAYLPANGDQKINSLEDYMNVPGLEKYREIITAKVDTYRKDFYL